MRNTTLRQQRLTEASERLMDDSGNVYMSLLKVSQELLFEKTGFYSSVTIQIYLDPTREVNEGLRQVFTKEALKLLSRHPDVSLSLSLSLLFAWPLTASCSL